MDVTDQHARVALHCISGLNDETLSRLILGLGSPRAVYEASATELAAAGMAAAPARQLERIRGGSRGPREEIDARLRHLSDSGAVVMALSDPDYPVLLRNIPGPPPLLYVRGDIAPLHTATLGIVGSRRASAAGLRAARALAEAAASAGLSICSGLAVGIDGAAHRGGLAGGAPGIAVLATGIERIYPRRHRALAASIEAAGCLVSEFPPGSQPLKHHFPRRNRIISGLSLGVLVVEAALPSGSLITAGTALEQGREVFALPWSPMHPGGAGCLRLLRDGATMVQSVTDILEELGPLQGVRQLLETPSVGMPEVGAGLSGPGRRLLELLGCEATSPDELCRYSGFTVARVLAELSELELAGLVERTPGGYLRC